MGLVERVLEFGDGHGGSQRRACSAPAKASLAPGAGGCTVGLGEHLPNDLTAVPWVRMYRQHYRNELSLHSRTETFAIDIVHRAFLSQYLTEHLLPFADTLGERVKQNSEVIADRKGFVSGMEKDSWTKLEARLQRHKKKQR